MFVKSHRLPFVRVLLKAFAFNGRQVKTQSYLKVHIWNKACFAGQETGFQRARVPTPLSLVAGPGPCLSFPGEAEGRGPPGGTEAAGSSPDPAGPAGPGRRARVNPAAEPSRGRPARAGAGERSGGDPVLGPLGPGPAHRPGQGSAVRRRRAGEKNPPFI